MAAYKYTAITKEGEKITGTVEGSNEFEAAQQIRKTCNIIIRITEVKPKKGGLLSMEIGPARLNEKAFTLMCSQFAVILQSGVPLRRTLKLIAAKTSDRKLKSILTEVSADIEAGYLLSSSFRERGGTILPSVFIETIAAGEESGNLAYAFQSMYEHFDKQLHLKAKVKNALSYPVFIIILSVVIVTILMVKVVPSFTSIFEFYETDLPWITESLIQVSLFFQRNILKMVIAIAIIAILFLLYRSTEKGKLRLSKTALKVPVFGNIRVLSSASTFANNFATLLASGLSIPKAITIVSRVVENYYISQEIGKIPSKIEAGKPLGECMQEAGCFPDILIDMTSVGAETGELEKTLSTIASYYDSELDTAVQQALQKMEPALLIVIAVIAGYIVLAVYMAMFQMYSLMA